MISEGPSFAAALSELAWNWRTTVTAGEIALEVAPARKIIEGRVIFMLHDRMGIVGCMNVNRSSTTGNSHIGSLMPKRRPLSTSHSYHSRGIQDV
jgi:hypothetical protein